MKSKSGKPKKVRCCDCGRLRHFSGDRFYCALLQKEVDSNKRFNTWIDRHRERPCGDAIKKTYEIRPAYFGFSCTG